MTLKQRYDGVISWFAANNPDADTELNFSNPFEIVVAVILSAQCTDKRVNMVTPALYRRYPTPQAMAESSAEEILTYISSVSYPNSKAHHLHLMARKLVEEYGGEVPADFDALLSLPGVGRKTANVVLSVAFGENRMAVDTHVFRVANRIGLTRDSKTPLHTEQTLVRHIPEHLLGRAHHWLILHGRYICTARKPKCDRCGIARYCRHFAAASLSAT